MKHIPIPPLRALRRLTVAAVLCALSMAAPLAHPASAQERSGNFLENLFNRGEPPAPQQGAQPQGQVAQGQGQGMASDPSDPGVRIDRLEGALRQLTGTVEQLQYRNQQLEMQLKRMQDDTEFRLQQLGSKGPPSNAQPTAPNVPGAPVPAGRRSDVFDPSQNPNAPGAPRTLGNASAPIDQPVGVPGGRAAGAPLDHVNNLGWTALIESIVLGDGGPRHVATLRALVQAGANVNLGDRSGTTPLALARGRSYNEMVVILTNAGAR